MRAERLGIRDLNRKYMLRELASGDVVFAATGVTTGTMLEGVRIEGQCVTTHSIVMRSATKTVRWIKMRHPLNDAG
jgi:fructose-1,6-bisphosphatase II / sedoheptulose-1,7-bisphosphatase